VALECGVVVIGLVAGFVVVAFYVMGVLRNGSGMWLCGSGIWL